MQEVRIFALAKQETRYYRSLVEAKRYLKKTVTKETSADRRVWQNVCHTMRSLRSTWQSMSSPSQTEKQFIIIFYNEEFDHGSGWTLATGLTHASRGAAGIKLA